MTSSPMIDDMLTAIETELKQAIDGSKGPAFTEFHQMLAYHMGWVGEDAGPGATGKRIRPLLVLLTCAAAGSLWERALPASAAVELLHNFSLIHDDIQDNSPLRRSRPTVWVKWGIPQAINAGDAMLTLAHLTLLRLEATTNPTTALAAMRVLQQTCFELTKGQFLDISYETRRELTLDEYWPMTSGKTGALISACTHLGALAAEAGPVMQAAYRTFGLHLGLAFQALDDLLGIWGSTADTGKSAESDLVSGKKTLPVLYGLGQNGAFARRWRLGNIQPDEVEGLARLLEHEGARDYTQETAACLTDKALAALELARPSGAAGEELVSLANRLLKRKI